MKGLNENLELFASEKSLNTSLYLLKNPRIHNIEYPVMLSSLRENNRFTCTSGIFNNQHWKILDLITTCMIHCSYISQISNKKMNRLDRNFQFKISDETNLKHYSTIDFKIPLPSKKSVKEKNKVNIENLKQILSKSNSDCLSNNDIKKIGTPVYEFKFNISDFKNCNKIIKGIPKKRIIELIKEIENYKICLNYEISYFCLETKHYKKIKLPNKTPSSLFRIKEIDSENICIIFDTTLGFLFCMNVISCNVFFLDENFYNKKLKNRCEFLYRKLILSEYDKNEITYTVDFLSRKMNLYEFNGYEIKTIIKEILDELKNKNLIYNYEYTDSIIKIQKNITKKIQIENTFENYEYIDF